MPKYRPSNGTEGEMFMSDWCARCTKDKPPHGCQIIALTMALEVDHPDYPAEWVEDDDGSNPRCTAFEAEKAARPEDEGGIDGEETSALGLPGTD